VTFAMQFDIPKNAAMAAISQWFVLTRRWSKTDSNHRSLSGRVICFETILSAGGVEEARSEKPPS